MFERNHKTPDKWNPNEDNQQIVENGKKNLFFEHRDTVSSQLWFVFNFSDVSIRTMEKAIIGCCQTT